MTLNSIIFNHPAPVVTDAAIAAAADANKAYLDDVQYVTAAHSCCYELKLLNGNTDAFCYTM